MNQGFFGSLEARANQGWHTPLLFEYVQSNSTSLGGVVWGGLGEWGGVGWGWGGNKHMVFDD